jgi:hypothetical protein
LDADFRSAIDAPTAAPSATAGLIRTAPSAAVEIDSETVTSSGAVAILPSGPTGRAVTARGHPRRIFATAIAVQERPPITLTALAALAGPSHDAAMTGWDGDLDYTCRAGRNAGSKGR